MATKNLEKERIARGWTLEYVGEQCDSTAQSVCDWEKGRCKPRYEKLVLLDKLFDPLKHDYLLADSET